jgi:hypothetical protein
VKHVNVSVDLIEDPEFDEQSPINSDRRFQYDNHLAQKDADELNDRSKSSNINNF